MLRANMVSLGMVLLCGTERIDGSSSDPTEDLIRTMAEVGFI